MRGESIFKHEESESEGIFEIGRKLIEQCELQNHDPNFGESDVSSILYLHVKL
jgi:hypothetical protein